MATLVPEIAGKLTVLPSEAGMAILPGFFLGGGALVGAGAIAPACELGDRAQRAGIVNLYQAMSSVWGIESEPKTAEEIVHEGLSAEPLCHQTLETFAGLLGGAAGNLALTVGARGGVYISGGIAPQLVACCQQALRRRFDERGDLSDYARAIPLFVVMDEHPGLLGARQTLIDP